MSIPGMLKMFREEWDALVLEHFELSQQFSAAKQELALSLYRHDAGCRVISRLLRENDDLRRSLNSISSSSSSSSSSSLLSTNQTVQLKDDNDNDNNDDNDSTKNKNNKKNSDTSNTAMSDDDNGSQEKGKEIKIIVNEEILDRIRSTAEELQTWRKARNAKTSK